MKFMVYLALLPCLAAANTILCPDFSRCPEGKTCCFKSGETYECCDIEEDNEEMYPGIPANGMDMPVQSKRWDLNDWCVYCSGTCCRKGCCEFKGANCCSDGVSCCARGNQCCRRPSSSKSEWCCPTLGKCASTYGYCYGGAGSLIPTISSIGALLFLLVLRGNYF